LVAEIPDQENTETSVQVIAFAQSVLAELALFEFEVDGIYGAHTAAAVRSFQATHGIRETGLLDGLTLAALRLESERRRAT